MWTAWLEMPVCLKVCLSGLSAKPQEWVKMSLHAVQSDQTHTNPHTPPIHCAEYMHIIDFAMIMRLVRTSEMMTNIFCAAKACQHAGSWHAPEKNSSRHWETVNTMIKKRQTGDGHNCGHKCNTYIKACVEETALEWEQGRMNGCTQKVKLEVEW